MFMKFSRPPTQFVIFFLTKFSFFKGLLPLATAQVEADLNMTGQYTVQGTGLSMVKVSGKDVQFVIWKWKNYKFFIYNF